MRMTGTALVSLLLMAQPALGQESSLTYEWAMQASPSELRTRILGPLAPLYRDASRPEKHYAGGYLWKITFASTPRTIGLERVCMSDVMAVEFEPVVQQAYRRSGHQDGEVRLDAVRTTQRYIFLEGAPRSIPTGEVSPADGAPYFDFDRVRTNEMCAEHSNGWTFTSARDGYLFTLGVDLLESVKDLSANNPTAFAALVNSCVGYQCSSLPTWFPTSSTDDITGVSEVDCEQIDGVHAENGRCLKLAFVGRETSLRLSLLGRRDENLQWRAFKFLPLGLR